MRPAGLWGFDRVCAIIDANVASEVFGTNRPEAGAKFFDWINGGNGRLFVGGQLLQELERTAAGNWAREALTSGRIRKVRESEVAAKTRQLQDEGRCRSDDPHILALAIVSGARLLYSNDGDLQHDFKDKRLIDKPRGKVYSTREYPSFQQSHARLLQRKDLCGS